MMTPPSDVTGFFRFVWKRRGRVDGRDDGGRLFRLGNAFRPMEAVPVSVFRAMSLSEGRFVNGNLENSGSCGPPILFGSS